MPIHYKCELPEDVILTPGMSVCLHNYEAEGFRAKCLKCGQETEVVISEA